jgi:hypothetical protein
MGSLSAATTKQKNRVFLLSSFLLLVAWFGSSQKQTRQHPTADRAKRKDASIPFLNQAQA